MERAENCVAGLLLRRRVRCTIEHRFDLRASDRKNVVLVLEQDAEGLVDRDRVEFLPV